MRRLTISTRGFYWFLNVCFLTNIVCGIAVADTQNLLDGLDLSGATHFVWEGNSLLMLQGARPKLTFNHVPTVEYTLGVQFTMRDSDSPHGPQNGQFGIYLPFGDDLVRLWLSGSGGGGNHYISLVGQSGDVRGGYTHLQIPPAVAFHDFEPHWASISVRPDDANAGISVWIDDEYVLGWEIDESLPPLSINPDYYPGVEAIGFTNWYGEVLFDHVELTEIPEPCTLILLALGGMMMRSRRRG